MNKILLIGNQGQLGNELANILTANNLNFLGINQSDLDLTQSELIAPFIQNYQPNLIINCSAYTAVDIQSTFFKSFEKKMSQKWLIKLIVLLLKFLHRQQKKWGLN